MILSPLDKRRSIGLAEAARVLGIPPRTLRRHAAEGALAVPDRCSRRLVRAPRSGQKNRR